MVTGPRGSAPHDLLQLQNVTGIDWAHLPRWAQDSLDWARWVVRRRAVHPRDRIPVGIRGRQRNQRHAWWVPVESVDRVVAPWELVDPLATYESTLAIRPESDLDVLIDTPGELPRERARELTRQFERLECAVDARLATPAGQVSLNEWATATAHHLLVRTESGPMLTANPWC